MSDLPRICVRAQSHTYSCTATALEYATGVTRDEIFREMGHKGDQFIDMYKDAGVPDCYSGTISSEVEWWAYRRRLPLWELTTFETIRKSGYKRMHDYLSVPTASELVKELQGRSAILAVAMKDAKDPDLQHHVAWIHDFALDPITGNAIVVSPDEVFSAMIFSTIDGPARKAALEQASRASRESLDRAVESLERRLSVNNDVVAVHRFGNTIWHNLSVDISRTNQAAIDEHNLILGAKQNGLLTDNIVGISGLLVNENFCLAGQKLIWDRNRP